MKLFQYENDGHRKKISLLGKKIFSYTPEHKKSNILFSTIKKIKRNYEIAEQQPLVSEFIKNRYFYELKHKKQLLENINDEESLKIITSVLSKYEYLMNGGTFIDYLYDAEMNEYIETTIQKFYQSIQKHDSWFSYGSFKLPINHFESSVFLDEHGLRKINKSRINPNDAIIDVGGFIADSVLIFRKNFPENTIISFEASNENYMLAQKTLQLNNIKNTIIEKTALGKNEGEIYINSFNNSATKTSVQKSNSKAETCPLTTLDSYVKKNNISKIGLIKVDIEGAEQNFLQGALETIKRDKPILLLSIYHNYNDLMLIKPFIESLNLNYSLKFHKPLDNLFYEILLICEPQD